MLSKYRQKRAEGFTIIEVLIVLAIAGLILLVVFLAVPALQRNARNTEYRNEANRIMSAYGEVSANKGGAVLTSSDVSTISSLANTKNITTITIEGSSGSTAPGNTSTVVIRTQSKCSAPDSATTSAGTARQVALLFNVETSSGTQIQCLAS